MSQKPPAPKRFVPAVIRSVPFGEALVSALYAFFDAQIPKWVKIQLVLAAVYFISPFDFVPDVIPFFGWTDDFAVLFASVHLFLEYVTDEHRGRVQDWIYPDDLVDDER